MQTNIDRRDTMAASNPVNSRRPVQNAPPIIAASRRAVLVAAQIAVLWLINFGASAVAACFHAPLPGSVLGLMILFTLLRSGVVQAPWLEPAATLLVKHLAFFFIPITIGLVDMGQLFALRGFGILFTLAVSAAVGMAMCGLTAQYLMKGQNAANARSGSEPTS